jgi:hypothetical protein
MLCNYNVLGTMLCEQSRLGVGFGKRGLGCLHFVMSSSHKAEPRLGQFWLEDFAMRSSSPFILILTLSHYRYCSHFVSLELELLDMSDLLTRQPGDQAVRCHLDLSKRPWPSSQDFVVPMHLASAGSV